jgi:choline kinase
MQAIILAAGIGKRLGATAAQQPKCLLEFGGRTLLEHHLSALAACGVDHAHVVTGFRAELIAAALADHHYTISVEVLLNTRYEEGSIVSLHSAESVLRSGQNVLIMDADVLYPHDLLRRLVNSAHSNCCLLDRDFEPGDEPVKLCVRDSRIVEFRKQLNPDLRFDYNGESVGFFKFGPQLAARLADITSAYVNNGRSAEPHEEAIRDLILEQPEAVGIEDISGLAWIEIDFPADIDRAKENVLPQIRLPI